MSVIKKATLALSMVSALTITHAHADEWQTSLGLSLGTMSMDKDSWSGEDRFGAIAINMELTKKSWPLVLSASLFTAGDEDKSGNTKTEDVVGGLQLGFKKYLPVFSDELVPYAGAGIYLSVAQKTLETGNITRKQKERDVNYYAGTGLLWHMNSSVSLGLDLRYTEVDVNLFNEKVDGGGLFSGLSLSYGF